VFLDGVEMRVGPGEDRVDLGREGGREGEREGGREGEYVKEKTARS